MSREQSAPPPDPGAGAGPGASRSQTPPATRVPARTKSFYGLGQAAEGIKNTAFNQFLFFFYYQVLGLSGTSTGLALFIATAFDAVTDPLTGSLSDRVRHRWGRRHPFMYASAVPLGVAFALLFTPPGGLSDGALFAWLLVFTLAVRGAMTLYHVPHLALGAELTSDYQERTRVVAYRTAFGIAGGVAVVVVAWLVFFQETADFARGQLDPSAYPKLGLTFGAVMTASILVSSLGTHDVIPRLPKPSPGLGPLRLRTLLDDYRGALLNPSFRAFFLGVVVFFVTRGIQEVLAVHMYTYFWQLEQEHILAVATASLPGLVLGVPFWAWAAGRLDKGPAFLTGLSLFSAMVLAPPIAKLAGFYPPADSPLYLGLLAGATFLGAFGACAGLVLAGSMIADVADEHELHSGARQEGIFFGMLSFAGKSTSGLGSFLAGVGIDLIAFPTQAVPSEVPQGQVDALGMLYGPGIAGLAVLAIFLLSRYRIDRTRHAAIVAALEQRHAGERGGTP